MALTAKEFEGHTVQSLKTLVAKRIGVPRFRQRWLGEDHFELPEDALVSASDVQLVVLDFVQAEDAEIQHLFDACERNQVDQVDELLRKPLDPDVICFALGKTALQLAAGFGHVECVSLLLEAGAEKDVTDRHGATALHWAAIRGHLEVVQLLLEAGADKNDILSGATPLHCAAQGGHREVVRLLLEAGADRESLGVTGETALHFAASDGHLQVVQLLLEAGADKAATTSIGMTALHLAALYGHLQVARFLSEAGVNKEASNSAGRSALDLATQHHHLEVVELLKAELG